MKLSLLANERSCSAYISTVSYIQYEPVWVNDVNGTFPLRLSEQASERANEPKSDYIPTLFVLLSEWIIALGASNVRSKSNCSEEVSAANHYFQKRYLFPQVLVCRPVVAPAATEIVTNGVHRRSQEQLVLHNFSGQSCCCRRPLKTAQTSLGYSLCTGPGLLAWEWCRML